MLRRNKIRYFRSFSGQSFKEGRSFPKNKECGSSSHFMNKPQVEGKRQWNKHCKT